MRPLRYLPLLVFFSAFLMLGLFIGRQLERHSVISSRPTLALAHRSEPRFKSYQEGIDPESVDVETQPDQPTPKPPLPTPTQPAVMPTPVIVGGSQPVQQNNILIIGVDDLEAPTPQLESAWLVLYISQTPHFTLMQIYPGKPSGQGDAGSPKIDLASLFQSGQQGSPDPDFFSELKARGLWWSGYIMVDRSAIAETIDLIAKLSGESEDQMLSHGSRAVARVPFTGHDPHGAYQGQVELVQKLCSAALHLNTDHISKLEDLFLLFGSHIISDIGREQLAAEMVGMLVYGNRISCELPFLSAGSP